MKISGRVDGGSVCSAVLSSRTPAVVTRAAATPAAPRRFCTAKESSGDLHRRPLGGGSFFCSKTSIWLQSTFSPGTDSRRPALTLSRRRHVSHTYTTTATATGATTPSAHPFPQSPVRDKKVLLSYVPPEDEGSVDEHFEFYRDPYRRGYAPADGPRVQVSEVKNDVEYPPREQVYTGGDKLRRDVTKLCSALSLRLRHPHRVSLETIYKLYSQLPEPRMLNLTGQWRNRLLRVMGTPRKRNMHSMLRYFALVADTKNAGLTLRRTQWNYALAFATKYAARTGAQEMDTALRMWREMEREAGVQGNDVTFNVLFDVAAKAGNFTLAEMVYNEMDGRGIEFNRFHHVSLIFYFGLKLDSGGIRAAYKEMVESGEMVDTVALNCVISGFLRCGEEAAAEETYRRMKDGNTSSNEMPARDYMTSKVVTKVLMMFSKLGRDHPELKHNLQTNVQLAPDLRTYRILVEHYAIKLGDLAKVAQYLDEMKFLKIPVHPTIFLALLKGFYVHGGFPGSQWSRTRLEGVLKALYDARDEQARGFRVDRWLVIWALRAVRKCSTTEAVLETFDDLSDRWDIPDTKEPFMQALLENIVQDRDLRKKDPNDTGTLYRGYNGESTSSSSSSYHSIE